MRIAWLLVALAATPALAQEEGTDLAPETAPVPELRSDPEDRLPEMEATEAPAEDAEPDPTAEPEPAPSPEDGAPTEADGEPLHAPPEGPPVREVLAETQADLAACLAELDALGTVYERAEPIAEQGQSDCGIVNPLEVTRLLPGVEVAPPMTVRCATALAAARWVADVVLPASRKLDDRGPLAALDVGTGYLCRPRSDGKLSEHAFGNAIDIMGFRFESGEPILVEPREDEGTLAESFQDATRFGACLDFSTVLGPGADAEHADHIHVDVRDRRGGFRICD